MVPSSVSKLKYTTEVTYNKEKDATKRVKKTNKSVKFVSKSKTVMSMVVPYDDKAADTSNIQRCTINVKYSPTKVGYKGLKWKVSGKKVVYVSPKGVVTPLKKGTATINGYTKDGTNKKVSIKVTITEKTNIATPTPNYEVESRQGTVVEDFEDYDVNEKWERCTKGKEYVDSNCGDMMVVQDPENAKNKVLRIRYNGNTQAYDFAPIFSLNLKDKTLENYSGVRLKSRVVSNVPDCTYKAVYVYFDKKNKITSEHYFATATKVSDALKKTTDKSSKLYGLTEDKVKELFKFDVEKPMAEGLKTEYNVKESGVNKDKKYMNRYFPMYYSDYSKKNDKTAVAPGYKETETGTVGFQKNTLDFQVSAIKETDENLLKQSRLDMVLGSTYAGKYTGGGYVTLYIDDIELLEGDIPLQSLDLEAQYTTEIAVGRNITINPLYTPENSTFKELKWTSSNTSVATVDAYGKVTGVKAGKTTITATCVKNNKIAKSVEINVFSSTPATENKVLDLSGFTEKKPEGDLTDLQAKLGSDVQAVKTSSGVKLPFTENNQSVVFELPETVDLTTYAGVSIRGLSDHQLSLEFYDANFDARYQKKDDNTYGDAFKKYNWYEHYQWCTYPFFGGTVKDRADDGTPTDEIVPETNFFDFETDGTIRGDMRNIKYVILKSNNWKEGSCEVYNITLLKDKPTKKYEN